MSKQEVGRPAVPEVSSNGASMPKLVVGFVRAIDIVNYRIGRLAVWLLFVMMAVLAWSIFTKAFLDPSLWTLETAQFIMVTYFLLGGPYAMQMGDDVRMDLFYGQWSKRTRALVDLVTIWCLITFLVVMLIGSYQSLSYALEVGETSPTAWSPKLWPIKVVITVALVLTLFQALASFIRSISALRGVEIPNEAERRGHVAEA